MATRGRKPKPLEQKRALGNPGKRALPDRGSLAAVPAIPPSLHDLSASDAVEAVLAEGVAWIAATDAPKVGLLREALEDYERVRAAGDFKQAMNLRGQIASLMSELGFDPAARSRLGLAEVKAKTLLQELME